MNIPTQSPWRKQAAPLCALYAPGVQCSLVSIVSLMRIGLSFGFRTNGLDLFYNGNLFGHVTLKGDFIVLDLDSTLR